LKDPPLDCGIRVEIHALQPSQRLHGQSNAIRSGFSRTDAKRWRDQNGSQRKQV
jgi:hypothetical protein